MSWETVSQHYGATQRALGSSPGQEFSIEDPPSLEQIAPLAGAPQLNDLLSRLLVAIEKPEQFEALGATPPKGAVLLGPPGLGKTLFARHLVARLSCPILTPDPAKLFDSPHLIEQLFATARANAPCVVLVDEADKLISLSPYAPPPTTLFHALPESEQRPLLLEHVQAALKARAGATDPEASRGERRADESEPPFHALEPLIRGLHGHIRDD